jgi:hypothetical protein
MIHQLKVNLQNTLQLTIQRKNQRRLKGYPPEYDTREPASSFDDVNMV